MVVGGYTHGTAQLDATASGSGTPDERRHVTNAPSAVSTAVIASARSGHSWTGSRALMTSSRPASVTLVDAARAWAPIHASISRVGLGRAGAGPSAPGRAAKNSISLPRSGGR